MKHLVEQKGLSEQFTISLAATTTEELGNDIYPNAKAELKRRGIAFEKRRARQIRSDEYADWDLIIAMDRENLAGIERIVGNDPEHSDPEHKVRLLLSFAGEEKSISDPWYTRNFAKAYDDIRRGCEALLGSLVQR